MQTSISKVPCFGKTDPDEVFIERMCETEETGDSKQSGNRGYTTRGHTEGGEGRQRQQIQRLSKSRAHRRKSLATIKRAGTEAIQIKGPWREEKCDNKESGNTNQGPAAGG